MRESIALKTVIIAWSVVMSAAALYLSFIYTGVIFASGFIDGTVEWGGAFWLLPAFAAIAAHSLLIGLAVAKWRHTMTLAWKLLIAAQSIAWAATTTYELLVGF
jgi:hypothetical protein